MQRIAALALLTYIAAGRIVLIDDISGEEKHGRVTIDSTRNGISHIVQKMNKHRDSSESSFLQGPRKYPDLPPIYQRTNERAHISYRRSPFDSQRSPFAENSFLHPFQKRIDRLTQRLHQVQEENDRKETNILESSSKKEALERSLKNLTKEKESVDSSLLLTKRELQTIQIELEMLRTKLKDLTERSEYLDAKKYKIQTQVAQLNSAVQNAPYSLQEYKKQIKSLKEQYENIKNQYAAAQGASNYGSLHSFDPESSYKYI
ncbi:hypothetical protein NECID01_1264 [Nematocida sp. AWRm77]|nr:hypothetical protein NECID01_1264 [Nematocida sp. AWRm77]